MLIEFLNPAKLPKQWGNHQRIEQPPLCIIHVAEKRISLTVSAMKALNILDVDFTHIQLINTDDNGENKLFILPCKKDGWKIYQNKTSANYTFHSTALVLHLIKILNLNTEGVKRFKIPVFIEPQDVKGHKCLQLNLKLIIPDGSTIKKAA